MIVFDWWTPSPQTEWLVNSVLSVCVIALTGKILLSQIPEHRAQWRSSLVIGVLLALLLVPLVRLWAPPVSWNRVPLESLWPEERAQQAEIGHPVIGEFSAVGETTQDFEPWAADDFLEWGSEEAQVFREPSFRLSFTDVLMAVWLLGLLVGAMKLGIGAIKLRRLDHHLRSDVEPEIESIWQKVTRGSAGKVRLRRGPEGSGAFTFGLIRRQVVVASDLLDTVPEEEIFTILAHEWAHVQQHDTWIGLLQRCTGILYWWLPWVHGMNQSLSLSREIMCDTAAAMRVDDPKFYAHSVLNLAAHSCRLKPATGTIGIAGSQSSLADRLLTLNKHYQTMKRSSHDPHRLRLPLAVAALSGLSLSWQLGVAQDAAVLASPPAPIPPAASDDAVPLPNPPKPLPPAVSAAAPGLGAVISSETTASKQSRPAGRNASTRWVEPVGDALILQEAALAAATSSADGDVANVSKPAPAAAPVRIASVTNVVTTSSDEFRRGASAYEKVAAPLREGEKKQFKFDQVKLGEVVAVLVKESGIDYISGLNPAGGVGAQEVTFSFSNVTAFTALERLAKHFPFELSYGDDTWSITEQASGFGYSYSTTTPSGSSLRRSANTGGGRVSAGLSGMSSTKSNRAGSISRFGGGGSSGFGSTSSGSSKPKASTATAPSGTFGESTGRRSTSRRGSYGGGTSGGDIFGESNNGGSATESSSSSNSEVSKPRRR